MSFANSRQLIRCGRQHIVCCLLFAVYCALSASIASAQQTTTVTKPPNAQASPPNATATPSTTKAQSDRELTVRVKDIAEIEGVRPNQLIGYGIVVGLNRTGDRVQQNLYARQTLQNLLIRMGIATTVDSLKPENMATVLVTATLPPFARQGARIDVLASSIGDARSLQGGTLILTPLKGVDGQIYAMAQGPVSIGGIVAGDSAAGNSVEVNHPTVGRVPNGATVERAVANNLGAQETLTLALRQDDFTTASRLNRTVNERFGAGTAKALDGRNVAVNIPAKWRDDHVGFIAELELLKLQTDMVAKVIINERTGTIIMGRDVRVSSVAISQGGVTVRIGTEYEVSQPSVFSKTGDTVTVPRTNIEVSERKPESVVLPDGATVDEVVRGLRSVGVSARDIISILQAIKAAGALAADLEMQ